MRTVDQIATQLNRMADYNVGLVFPGSVKVFANTVRFDYPAPVVSGVCTGQVTVLTPNGKIHDDVCDQLYPNVRAWLVDQFELMQTV